MAKKIYKHTFTITVLSEDRDTFPQMEIESVAEAIDTGDDIGKFEHKSVEEVPPDRVHDELLALGNDGDFFNVGPDSEEEFNTLDNGDTSDGLPVRDYDQEDGADQDTDND